MGPDGERSEGYSLCPTSRAGSRPVSDSRVGKPGEPDGSGPGNLGSRGRTSRKGRDTADDEDVPQGGNGPWTDQTRDDSRVWGAEIRVSVET